MTGQQIAALGAQNGKYVNFSYVVDNVDNVVVNVNSLSYFSEKVADANSARLGSAQGFDGSSRICEKWIRWKIQLQQLLPRRKFVHLAGKFRYVDEYE